MKRNVLVIIDRFKDAPSANTLCVQSVLKEMVMSDINVEFTVLSTRLRLFPGKNSTFDGYKVLEIFNIWYYLYYWGHGFSFKSRTVKLFHTLIRKMLRIPQKVLRINVSDKFFSARMIRHADKLIAEKGFSDILTVSMPFSAHRIGKAIKDKHEHLHWVVYELDPYTFNYTFSIEKKILRSREEIETYAHADRIITTPEINASNEATGFRGSYRYKTLALPLPNLRIDSEIQTPTIPKNKLQLVYCGRFYEDIRNPKELLYLLENMETDNYELHIYGDGCKKQIEDWNTGKHKIVHHGVVSKTVCQKATSECNALVNVGNDINNQMPSKVLDYIATGKPIVSVMSRDDPSFELLSRYPYAFVAYKDECKNNSKLSHELDRFLSEHGNKIAPKEEIFNLYRDYTASSLAMKMARFLEWIEKQ